MTLFVVSNSSFAQNNSPLVKAEKLHKAFAFHEAIEEYQKVLLKEPENAPALRGIADCYRMTNNTERSEYYFAKVAKLEDAKPIDKFHYAQALMYNAKYTEAKKYFTEYSYTATTDERAHNSLSAIAKLDEFFKKKDGYNDEQIMKEFGISEKKVKKIIEWYARLILGEKIAKCVEKQGDCEFDAEL